MIAIGHFFRSSSFRVGVVLTSLALIAILFIVYFWRLASSDVFTDEAKAAVNSEVFGLTQLHKHLGIDAVIEAISERDLQPSRIDERTILALRDKEFNLIAGTLPYWPMTVNIANHEDNKTFGSTQLSLTSPLNNTNTSRVIFDVVSLDDYQLFVARDITALSNAQWLGKTVSWVIIALLFAVCAISFAVALYVVNRINRMSQTADNIIRTGNLEERLEIDSNWDDLSHLSVVFNRMLDTIEGAVDNIKSVSDSIAHDLRTPLARLRNTLDRIDNAQLRQETIYEADNLLNMFNSLLRISRIETTQKNEGFCTTQLDALTADVVDLYLPFAEESHILFEYVPTPISFNADPNLLFQAIANVVDNAIKYSTEHGHVVLEMMSTSTHHVVMISDNGPGVSEHELGNLERRFYRSDKSRTDGGNGLGLSLVSAIIKLHKGNLWFVHDPLIKGHGLGVVFTFPNNNAPSLAKAGVA